jgi:hypothetical protein
MLAGEKEKTVDANRQKIEEMEKEKKRTADINR